MHPEDPRREVEAPVRHALGLLVRRALVLVGVTVAIVLAPSVAPSVAPALALSVAPTLGQLQLIEDAAAIGAPLVLFAFAGFIALERRRLGRPPEDLRAAAWFRARETDEADATLALVITGWVPVALIAALVVLAWPHLNDRDLTAKGLWSAVGLPTLAAAWLLATNAWLESARDILARAQVDSEQRFRHYWANIGR